MDISVEKTLNVAQSDQAATDLRSSLGRDGQYADKEDVTACEVFQETSEGVNFRTVSWQRATVLFLKIQFAMSILAVPSSLGALGAVGGALSIVGWQALNTCAFPHGLKVTSLWVIISLSLDICN